MLVIFSEKKTQRLQYILQTIMDVLSTPFELTDDAAYFINTTEPKINYSRTKIAPEEYWIMPVELLFETSVKEQPITFFTWKNYPAFFKAPQGDCEFDVFAASFFLITRYEEYLPHGLDEYGRYAYQNSIAFKNDFLKLPLVNFWLNELTLQLKQKFSGLNFTRTNFKFLPTYDIDIAWSYLEKGALRNVGGFLKSILEANWEQFTDRIKVLLTYKNDPFDVYQWLDDLHQKHHLKPLYFFLLAQQKGKYDKNIDPTNSKFQRLIKKLSTIYKVGIHPSWQSGDQPLLAQEERKLLSEIIQQPVTISRQHYIRMALPDTYQHLIEMGIEDDFSMGYGSINGFRCSYALPFKWYNLSTETITGLKVHPFCYMEANSIFEQQFSPTQAREELEHYYNITKQVNGTLVTIFHNHLLTQQSNQIAWRNMYQQFLNDHF